MGQGVLSERSRLDLTRALTIGDNDSFRRNPAIAELKGRRDRAFGEQAFARAERDGENFEP